MSTYERSLNRILDQIFAKSNGMSLLEFSKKAGLAVSTVWNINYRYTKLPRLKTIFCLARAVGMELELVEKQIVKGRRGIDHVTV